MDGAILPVAGDVMRVARAWAGEQAPREACGLLVGRHRGGLPVVDRLVPCTNIAASPTRYAIDPTDLYRVGDEAERRGEEIIGVMHSHPSSPAWPSTTDIDHAVDGWLYLIVSPTETARSGVCRWFRIVAGDVTELTVRESRPQLG